MTLPPDSGSGGPRRPPVYTELDPGEQRRRLRNQVESIMSSMRADGVDAAAYVPPDVADRDDVADFDYLYVRHRVLVRSGDAEAVRQLIGGDIEPLDGMDDLSALIIEPAEVDGVLARVDDELGPGVATPDHVYYVTPGTASCCPASEPEWMPPDAEPVPPLRDDDQGTGRGVRVSVVDTGWWEPEANARAQQIAPWLVDVTGDQETITDGVIPTYGGHGTFVAGVVRTMAPEAVVRVEGFLRDRQGGAAGAITESAIVRQLVDALAREPHIISMSAGTTSRRRLESPAFERFAVRLRERLPSTILVAAAGNDGSDREFWPAAYDWVTSVGSLDPDGTRSAFSNHGSWVDVYARGAELVNAFAYGTYTFEDPANEQPPFEGRCRWSGTSFATPLVAGLVAARMSATGETAQAARSALLKLARAYAVDGAPARLDPAMPLW